MDAERCGTGAESVVFTCVSGCSGCLLRTMMNSVSAGPLSASASPAGFGAGAGEGGRSGSWLAVRSSVAGSAISGSLVSDCRAKSAGGSLNNAAAPALSSGAMKVDNQKTVGVWGFVDAGSWTAGMERIQKSRACSAMELRNGQERSPSVIRRRSAGVVPGGTEGKRGVNASPEHLWVVSGSFSMGRAQSPGRSVPVCMFVLKVTARPEHCIPQGQKNRGSISRTPTVP